MNRLMYFFLSLLIMLVHVTLAQPRYNMSLDDRIESLQRRVASLEEFYNAKNTDAGLTTEEAVASPIATRGPLSITLLSKELHQAGPGEKSDQLGFSFEFRNTGKKDIAAFMGSIVIRYRDGMETGSFPFNLSRYLAVGDIVSWYSGWDYDPLYPVHKKWRESSLADVIIVLRLDKVMYSDATFESF